MTSFKMSAEDELILDALREAYGTEISGEAIRRGLRAAAAAEGIAIDTLDGETAAAA